MGHRSFGRKHPWWDSRVRVCDADGIDFHGEALCSLGGGQGWDFAGVALAISHEITILLFDLSSRNRLIDAERAEPMAVAVLSMDRDSTAPSSAGEIVVEVRGAAM